MRCMDLSCCENITDLSLQTINDACNEGLLALRLRSCNVTDEGLCYFKDTSSLRLLNLCNTHVGDRGISSVALACPSLTSLTLRQTLVTDVALKALAHNCPSLSYLNVAFCKE